MMKVVVEASSCVSCGACVVICPCHAITLSGGVARIDPERCAGCGRCVSKCYTRAILVVEDA